MEDLGALCKKDRNLLIYYRECFEYYSYAGEPYNIGSKGYIGQIFISSNILIVNIGANKKTLN